MALLTNVELWNKLRQGFPSFASHTSEGTKELFTLNGFEALKRTDISAVNEFFELSLRVWLDTVNISHARDPLADITEVFERPYGAFTQKMAIYSMKPVTPKYSKLVDGDWVNQDIINKPKTEERFFKQNFDFQSMVTVPFDYMMKQIFVSEFGMSEFMAGIMQGLENAWIIQKYLNKKEAINAGINSTVYPLKDTQKVNLTMSASPTSEELTNFILAVNDTVTAMTIDAQTKNFNALSFPSVQDKSRLKLLVRAGYKNLIKVQLLTGAFNPQNLNLDVDIVEVTDFGGLVPYQDAEYTTPVYPVYNELGTVIGYNTEENATEVTIQEDAVFYKDPNENVIALLMDRGWVFESIQNGYQVFTHFNYRGMYTNYFANCPNNLIGIDPIHNLVVFTIAPAA